MNLQQRLQDVAERYRRQGYQVTVDPGPNDLPTFAKDFKVEIVATRPGSNVLVSAKATRTEFMDEPRLARYAEAIESQPGWRYDVFVLEPAPLPAPDEQFSEPSEAEVSKALDEAEQLARSGYVAQSVLSAWSALESTMRVRLRSLGNQAKWGTSTRSMLNELYSDGIFSERELRELEAIAHLRNVIVHGFALPQIKEDTVQFINQVARRLLDESHALDQAS